MAKIVSPVWSSARGSIGNVTYLTTPAGAIIARPRSDVPDRGTDLQISARLSLQAAADAWLALTSAARSGWDAYALTAGFRTGRQAFIAGYGLSWYLVDSFSAVMDLDDSPPEIPGRLAISGFRPNYHRPTPGVGIRMSFENNSVEAVTVFLQASDSLPVTRNFWAGPWLDSNSKVAYVAAGATSNPAWSGDADSAMFATVRAVTRYGPKRISTKFRYRSETYTFIVP